MRIIKSFLLAGSFALVLTGCGSTSEILSTPIENIDALPLKVSDLTDVEKNKWGHLDLVKDTIPGMSVEKAYAEIIKNKKGQKVIVAVIDSGIDIDHEDLNGVIWTNKGEIPGNGIDDDNNGYVDDIHGWNFLGEAYDEQLEHTRIVASGDTSNPDYEAAKAQLEEDYDLWTGRKAQYDQIAQAVKGANETLANHLGKEDYTLEEVNNIETEDEALSQAIQVANGMNANGLTLQEAIGEINGALVSINERLNFLLNVDFNGRTTGDDINDFSEIGYGDNNVKPVKKDESHGTHVAGIIAAMRDNGIGMNGVANNVEIMSIRAVPNGDEYDKDVALAIRYAVDNGAKVINGSFGKSFSPHADKVRDAIKYASDNDVVFVHAAGNSSENIDVEPNFPDDNVNFVEVSDTYIRVGALTSKYGSSMVSSFSNYGKKNVDVFAPGSAIYSTFPENEYKAISGTSMAAPGVAGVVALVRSYYPKLTAAQVKQVILESGLPLTTKVVVGGDSSNVKPFSDISKSGRVVNAYNALIMADQLSK
ncbi:S8 family peptidase [Oceanihabitans sediminis]|uniref:Peptidase S8 n=1 Tax=Oceanihabitans sediminis TaxID=1812012 RepID=A0A368P8F0_9FLAO|nr:S8 family peptidase [Oceanihabitans sediminis]MDX1277360.1 S8 family peptidase [Oceanihabitans sediminis]MDX1773030.1 S8 family peptidase [Oceanihabitans sediminis]RBP34723.1 subtilase family protein [Oceanihabitans sediminis]RCU58374.1 peptidase S8 [Oceanihabitans sediminis]